MQNLRTFRPRRVLGPALRRGGHGGDFSASLPRRQGRPRGGAQVRRPEGPLCPPSPERARRRRGRDGVPAPLRRRGAVSPARSGAARGTPGVGGRARPGSRRPPGGAGHAGSRSPVSPDVVRAEAQAGTARVARRARTGALWGEGMTSKWPSSSWHQN